MCGVHLPIYLVVWQGLEWQVPLCVKIKWCVFILVRVLHIQICSVLVRTWQKEEHNQRSSGSFTWYNKVYILSSPVCCMLGGEQTSLPVCSLPRVCWYQLLAYVSSKGNICLWAAHRVLLHFWCVYPRVWFMTVAVASVRWCVYPGCRETKKAARCTCYDVCPPRAPTGRRRGRGLPKKTAAPSTGESSFHYQCIILVI